MSAVTQNQLELLESLIKLPAKTSNDEEISEQSLKLDIEDPSSVNGLKSIKIIL